MKFATKVHVTVELGDGSRYVQTAAGPEVTIGRDLTGFDHYFSSISIDDPGVSREHARLLVDADGTLSVEDLGSRNGTFVGGRRLEHGAVERLGADGKLSLGGIEAVVRIVDQLEPYAFGKRIPTATS
jgi:pSer/pThr/pTyr-binding forkhead associated (FHA) protein